MKKKTHAPARSLGVARRSLNNLRKCRFQKCVRQSLGAGRRDDDIRVVLSAAVTSPEAEERRVKISLQNFATLSGHGLETDRLARTFQAGTPLSWAQSPR